MQLLSSKTYDHVDVQLRNDESYTLPTTSGLKLMDYLTGEVSTKHVKLTDKDGTEVVVLITDILRVVPHESPESYKKRIEEKIESWGK